MYCCKVKVNKTSTLILMLYCVVLGTAFYEAEVVIGLSSLPVSQINEAKLTPGMWWQEHCRWQM